MANEDILRSPEPVALLTSPPPLIRDVGRRLQPCSSNNISRCLLNMFDDVEDVPSQGGQANAGAGQGNEDVTVDLQDPPPLVRLSATNTFDS